MIGSYLNQNTIIVYLESGMQYVLTWFWWPHCNKKILPDECMLSFVLNDFSNVQGPLWDLVFICIANTMGELSTRWGRVTHVCDSKLPIPGSDNGLSPGRRQAII